MKRTSFAAMQCSLARGLELIGDWWTPLIVRDLFLGLSRFEELIEDLGLSRNLLAIRLRSLEKSGIVARYAYQARPRRYAYRLSAAGLELVPVLVALTAWGDRWARPREGIPIMFRHSGCGGTFSPAIVCPECREPLEAASIVAMPGPGARARRGTRIVGKFLTHRRPQGRGIEALPATARRIS
jgi:DNA-binding HxlR family transcriptional regulator